MMRGIPPGVHIQATQATGAGPARQLRILGDERHGYLIAGLLGVPHAEDKEFWFSTLVEALGAARRLGVSSDAWAKITAVNQVRAPDR